MWKYVKHLAVLATIASAFFAYLALQEQRTVRQSPDDKNQLEEPANTIDATRAWTLVNSRVPGTAGKSMALEFLNNSGESLSGIDLSCTTMGGDENWKVPFEECRLPVRLESVNLVGANLFEANLEGVDLALADLSRADMTRASIRGANFASADLTHTNLVQADARNGWFYNSNLSGAMLWGANFHSAFLQNTRFDGANVSNVVFGNNNQIETASFEDIWAWRDQPPSDLEGVEIRICDYVSGVHDRMKRPDEC